MFSNWLRWLACAVCVSGVAQAADQAAGASSRCGSSARPGTPKDALNARERAALLGGRIVARPLRFSERGARYVGGVAYQLVRASPDRVLGALSHAENLPRALPRTKRAELIDREANLRRVELVQGVGLIEATYTVHMQDQPGDGEILFWLDASRPHSIGDVWGYIRVCPFGPERSLITVAAAVDLGSAILRFLFEDSIERLVLESPEQIRTFLEQPQPGSR